jgi:hypothetical protein
MYLNHQDRAIQQYGYLYGFQENPLFATKTQLVHPVLLTH